MNKFMIGANSEREFRFVIPPPPQFSRDDALNLAAWLYLMAAPSEEEWEKIVAREANG